MKEDIWVSLERAAKENKIVQVSLTPGAQIHRAKRRPGRPRVRGAVRFGHYAGYIPEEGGRPRCEHSGCAKYLRRDQKGACSPEHALKIAERAAKLLERLKTAA